jgi:hypothetical protein
MGAPRHAGQRRLERPVGVMTHHWNVGGSPHVDASLDLVFASCAVRSMPTVCIYIYEQWARPEQSE